MMCCALTGQGAGVTAALSIKNNVASGSASIGEVQTALKNRGVRID
jgi:hypothetical protein